MPTDPSLTQHNYDIPVFIQRDSNEDNEANGPRTAKPSAPATGSPLFDWLLARGWAFVGPYEMQYSVGQHIVTVYESNDKEIAQITVKAFGNQAILWRADLFSAPLETIQSVIALAERGL